MKLLYMGLHRVTNNPDIRPVELCHAVDVSSYSRFTRGTVTEFLTWAAGTVGNRTKPGVRQRVEEKGNFVHVYSPQEGICAAIISDDEHYPLRVAQQLLSKIADEFLTKYPRTKWSEAEANKLPFPELNDYIVKYQDPNAADNIMKIQKELDETKVVLHKTIESVLERGEKIDNLVAKSDGLSAQSKMFYTQAKKQNSCCVVM